MFSLYQFFLVVLFLPAPRVHSEEQTVSSRTTTIRPAILDTDEKLLKLQKDLAVKTDEMYKVKRLLDKELNAIDGDEHKIDLYETEYLTLQFTVETLEGEIKEREEFLTRPTTITITTRREGRTRSLGITNVTYRWE